MAWFWGCMAWRMASICALTALRSLNFASSCWNLSPGFWSAAAVAGCPLAVLPVFAAAAGCPLVLLSALAVVGFASAAL